MPWLLFFRNGVSMSSSCLEGDTNISYITYLQRESLVPLIVVRRQEP
jgi:hypothetical protein